jgi:hypothetical protein
MDLCRKITENGGKIHCLVEANIVHLHNVCGSKAPSAWVNHVSYMARYLYLYKYGNRFIAGTYRLIVGIAGLLRILVFAGISIIDHQYYRNLKIGYNMLTFCLIYCGSDQLRICPDNGENTSS